MVIAEFIIKEAFEVETGLFAMTGDVVSGRLRKGMVMNLVSIGIDRYVGIEELGFMFDFLANDQQQGITVSVRGLGRQDRQMISQYAPFSQTVEVRGDDV